MTASRDLNEQCATGPDTVSRAAREASVPPVASRLPPLSDEGRRLLHPVLASRWSPRAFEPSSEVSLAEIDSMVEAARWAPSAGNSQPWGFIIGRRGEPDHDRVVRHLTASSAAWAPTAALLVVNLAHRFVENTDWGYSEFSLYDLGQAVAHMTFQAQSLGLAVRQFRAFDRDGLAAEFNVPPHWEITTISAIGRPQASGSKHAHTSGQSARDTRERRPANDLRWPRAGIDHR
jgi:nitroreductase